MSLEKWAERHSGNNAQREDDYRTPYEKDYARVIHSAALRRLQRKTQVLGLGDGDFYRTRLTHTIEVSQIANGICTFLRSRNQGSSDNEFLPSQPLISCICASHDIGHPPFGHGGEIALNFMMRSHGGFEGNAHTLRLLTKYEQRERGFGLDLSRRALLGVIKYPVFYSEARRKELAAVPGAVDNVNYRRVRRSDWKPPKCIFDEERSVLDWILSIVPENEKTLFCEMAPATDDISHRKPLHKSIDASIMELADDISYGVHDLEDAIHLNMVEKGDFEVYLEECKVEFSSSWAVKHKLSTLVTELFGGDRAVRKSAIGRFINALISAISIKKDERFSSPILGWNAVMEEGAGKALKAFKDFVYERVVKIAEVQTLEYRGQLIIMEMFDAIISDPKRFLPRDNMRRYEDAVKDNAGMRFVCDYIAGMTDDYATRVYERFFVPRSGSVFQRL